MSPASSNLQNKTVTTCQSSMELPPILKLPVELRYQIYTYATDEQQWFAPESERIRPLPLGRNRFGQRHFRDTSNATLSERHKAFLTTNTSDLHKARLTCAHPIARVNKQLRLEMSDFLRTSSMPIVTRVRDFDFSHVQHFLSTSEEAHQNTFKVRHDGTSGRYLIIELQAPYTTSSTENLRRWIEYVEFFVGPEKRAELSALYKTIDVDNPMRAAITMIVLPQSPFHDADLYRCLPITAVEDAQKYCDKIKPGVGRIEVNKIVATLTAWLDLYWV